MGVLWAVGVAGNMVARKRCLSIRHVRPAHFTPPAAFEPPSAPIFTMPFRFDTGHRHAMYAVCAAGRAVTR